MPAIDFYANAEAWQPTATTTLHDLIDAIRSEEFAETVSAVRSLIEIGDKAGADRLKRQLPAVSLSGVVNGRRKGAAAAGRFTHSGWLQVDLDAKDNPGWTTDEMCRALKASPHIAAVFLTPSGTGVKGVARIPSDVSQHKASFLAAEAHFAGVGLKIDKSCKDPVRLCFVSHDPDAWLRDGEADEIVPTADDVGDELPHAPGSDDREPEAVAPRFSVSDSGGLVIRGGYTGLDLTPEIVREMLACIPYPGYDRWLKIANAVWDALGEDGTPILQEWAPEKKPGDYSEKWAHRLKDVHAATLIMEAKAHGWSAPPPVSMAAPRPTIAPAAAPASAGKGPHGGNIPPHVFPVPCGEIGHDLSARHIFAVIAPTLRLFMRHSSVTEVVDEDDGFAMSPVTGKRFASEIETFAAKVMRRELREDGLPRWRSVTYPVQAADIALASSAARTLLPRIRQLVSSPAIVPDGEGSQTLCRGYHPHGGGTYITSGDPPPDVPLDEAVAMLTMVLHDFDFPDGGDASRAIASLISPALKIGGWIDDDFPLDIAEADQSQSGKSYRFKLIHAIYGESPSAITPSAGGVGSLDERVSRALITGRPFISFDNFRGRMDSQILETAIRGLGRVAARALRAEADIDCTPFIWQLSTNGAELTRDLANRSIITRIRKRPDGHVFQSFPEGDVLAHVRAHQARFLGAVHTIVRTWVQAGRPVTTESRHDFRTWCRVLDWIVQHIFQFPPLLDGHREEQMRSANPRLQWLRDVIHAVINGGYHGQGLTASDIAETADESDIPLPGRKVGDGKSAEFAVGKTLGRIFRETGTDTVMVDGQIFRRQIEHEYDPVSRKHRERKIYSIDGFAVPPPAAQPDPQASFL